MPATTRPRGRPRAPGSRRSIRSVRACCARTPWRRASTLNSPCSTNASRHRCDAPHSMRRSASVPRPKPDPSWSRPTVRPCCAPRSPAPTPSCALAECSSRRCPWRHRLPTRSICAAPACWCWIWDPRCSASLPQSAIQAGVCSTRSTCWRERWRYSSPGDPGRASSRHCGSVTAPAHCEARPARTTVWPWRSFS